MLACRVILESSLTWPFAEPAALTGRQSKQSCCSPARLNACARRGASACSETARANAMMVSKVDSSWATLCGTHRPGTSGMQALSCDYSCVPWDCLPHTCSFLQQPARKWWLSSLYLYTLRKGFLESLRACAHCHSSLRLQRSLRCATSSSVLYGVRLKHNITPQHGDLLTKELAAGTRPTGRAAG